LQVICERDSKYQRLSKQVIHQLGRHREMNMKFNQGVVTTEDYLLEINRIRMATIELLDELKK